MAKFNGFNPYQQNLRQEQPKQQQQNKWYSGSQPTTMEIYGRIGQAYEKSKLAGTFFANQFAKIQQNPDTVYYNPYSTATNRAVSNLQSYGIDTSNINDDWFKQNDYLRQYLTYDGTTNTPTKPGKKASAAEKAAYEYYQIWKSEDTTKKAEQEWAALQEELKYKAGWKDRNMSDDDIINSIDWSKYSTLRNMDDKKNFQPVELNRGISYSKENMYGVLWSARNGGGSENLTANTIAYAMGKGNKWQDNPSIREKLDAGNVETYSPYSVGSTMDDALMYFGVNRFDRKWLQENRASILGGNDATAKKYYSDVAKAVEYTEGLDNQLKAMNDRVDTLMKYYKDPEKIINAIKNDTQFKDLFDLDATMENGTELKDTAYAVNYRWRDMEKKIRDKCEKKDEKTSIGGLLTGLDKNTWLTPRTGGTTTGTAQKEITTENPVQLERGDTLFSGNETEPEAVEEEKKKTKMDVWHEAFRLGTMKKIVPMPLATNGKNPEITDAIERHEPGQSKGPQMEHALQVMTEEDRENAKAAYDEKYGVGAFERDLELADEDVIRQPGLAQADAETQQNLIDDDIEQRLESAYDAEYGTGAYAHAMMSKKDSIKDQVKAEARTLMEAAEAAVKTNPPEQPKPEAYEPEPFTESDLSLDEAMAADMESIAGAVEEFGTAAEKTALETGKTTLFERGVHFIKDVHGDFVERMRETSTENVAQNYIGNYQTITDYNSHLSVRDEKQARLDELMPEWEELAQRQTASASIAEMDEQEYANLIAFRNDADNGDWNMIKADLDRGPGESEAYGETSTRQIRFNEALAGLYQAVTGTQMPTDERGNPDEEALEKAKTWYSFLQQKTPIQKIVDNANANEEGTDEIEIDEGDFMIRLERNDDGQFEFAGAVNTKTGDVYGPDWEDDVNQMLGFNGMTQTDSARFEELDRIKTSLENDLQEEADWLGAYAEDYRNAQMDNQFLAVSYKIASMYSDGETDPGLITKIENLYNISVTPVKDEYPSYNQYDAAMESGEFTREVVSDTAKKNAADIQRNIDELTETLAYLDKLGVPFSDEQRKNIEARLGQMRRQQQEAAYSMLDGMDDFRSVVDSTLKDIKSTASDPVTLALAQYRQDGDMLALQNMIRLEPNSAALKRISNKEIDRYLYLYSKDGAEAAQKYLDYLADPNNGVLTARDMESMQTELREFAGENALNAAVATGLSFVTNQAAGPSSFVYRIGQWLKGEDVSPINPAYQGRNFTTSARQGSKDFLSKVVDPNSLLGQLTLKGYDIAAGLVDFKAGSAMMGELFEGLGISLKGLSTDNLAVKFLKSAGEVLPSTLNSAESVYQNILTQTGDEEKAGQMAAISFATGLLSHAVVMQGIHSAFQANPGDVQNFISGLFQQVLKTDAAVGVSGLTTNIINAAAEKAILGADSEWGKNYQSFLDAGYPQTVAEQLANQMMQDKIFNDTLNDIVNATLRTAVTYTAGAVKNSEPVQQAFRKIEDVWEGLKNSVQTGIAKVKGTYTEEVHEAEGMPTFGSIKDANNIPENLKQVIPDNAILNPVNGAEGTTMYDRTTGKAHNVVAFMTTGEGNDFNIVFIDDQGEQIPFTKIAVQNGAPANNLTGDEYQLLTYGYQYGRQIYEQTYATPVDETAGNQNAWPGEFTQGNVKESGRPALMGGTEPTEAVQTESVPPVASLPPVEAPKVDHQNQAKVAQVISGTYNARPETATVGIAAVLDTGDEHVDQAAAQTMISDMAYGDTRVSAMVMQQIMAQAGESDQEALRTDLAQAAVTKGAGHEALNSLFEKTRNGEPITAEDIQAVRDGLAQDRGTNPAGFARDVENAVTENRIANRTNQIAAGRKDEVQKAEGDVASAQQDVADAIKGLNQSQAILDVTVQNVTRAVENVVNDSNNNDNVAGVEQEANKIPGAATVVQQQEDAVRKEEQKLTEAKTKLKQKNEAIMTESRALATEEVNKQKAEEQAEAEARANEALTAGEETETEAPVNAALEAGSGNSITVNPTPPPTGEGDKVAALDAGENGQTMTVNPNAQRQFGHKTAQENDALHEEVKKYLYENSDYEPDTNSAQIDRALDWVSSHAREDDPDGYHGAVNEVTSPDFNWHGADGQARMLAVLGMAAAKGDVQTEMRIAAAYNEQGTEAGQQLQARKIFRMMSPAGRRMSLLQEVDKVNNQYKNKGKDLNITLSDELLEEAGNAKTEEEFAKVREKAEEEIASQIPADWKLKIQTWRMLSMLGNPRTHIRNITGNVTGAAMVAGKNTIAAGIEGYAEKHGIFGHQITERTKSVTKDEVAKEFAAQDVENVMSTLTGDAKYGPSSRIDRKRKAFGQGEGIVSRTVGKVIQAASDKTGELLEKEDAYFLRKHYTSAMAGYMTANNLKPEDMTGETLDKAREYAINEAQKATYRDANAVSDTLNALSKKGGVGGFLVDAVVPFKKTPANIMRRGIEYSPVGLVKSVATAKSSMDKYEAWVANGRKGEKPKGAKSANEVIDDMAAGLTGTGVAALGAFLYSIGALTIKQSEPDAELAKERGSQDYALQVQLFGHNVSGTLDWMVPTSMPLFFGAAMKKAGDDMAENGEISLTGVLDAVAQITEPAFNLSMLDGISSLIKSASYSNGAEAAWKVVEKIIANYASSMFPTIGGAFARTIDPTRRKAYTPTGSNVFDQAIEQIQNKIPFLASMNIPYRDVWGNAETSSHFEAFLENFILPGYIDHATEDEVNTELQCLFDETGDKSVVPKTASKTVGDVKLDDKQYDQYSVKRGQTAKELLNDLIKRPEFIALTETNPEAQVQFVKDVWEYANAVARKDLFPDYEPSSWIKRGMTEGNPLEQIFAREEVKAMNASADAFKNDTFKAIEMGDSDSLQTSIAGWKRAGKSDKSIKQSLSNHYKELYQQAFLNGDDDVAESIRSGLMMIDLGDSNYTLDLFEKWENEVLKKNGI